MTTSHPNAQTRVPRILVVDDTADNLFLMNGLLEDRYEVLQAASGQEALKVVMSDNPPDMLLLDIMMPDMDGYEVLRRMRQHPPVANIPVIFLTALDGPQNERLGMDLGALDYLTKPVNPDAVVRRIQAHMKAATHARRMEALSERLSRHLTPGAWQDLFHGGGQGTIAFAEKTLSVLYAESGDLRGWGQAARDGFTAELQWLATRHQGTVDHFGGIGTVVFFEEPGDCVHMAMDLQRSAAEQHLRMGVHTCLCEVASFRSDGQAYTTLVGAETGLAARVAATAGRGSIVVSPETYVQVQAEVHADPRGCLLTEEFQDSDLATASLTPTPLKGGHAASTFAGLGRL